MAEFEIGLQHRLKRVAQQTVEQHRQLAAIQRELVRALAGDAPAEARGALERYAAALRAHFELEQGVVFPALHGLAPERTPELDALEGEHALFLGELVELARQVAAAPSENARQSLARHLERLREHERREESLVAASSGQGH
jgi:hypothetical protein